LAGYFKDAVLSAIHHLIDLLCRKNHIVVFREHHFLSSLNAQSWVVDLGAHKGEFSAQLSKAFGCHCISVEANPVLFNGIAENALINKFNYAICGQNGPVHFYLSDNLEASSIIKDISDFWTTEKSIQVAGIKLEDLFEKCSISIIDLLKVDIEGGEIEMFKTMSDITLRGMKQITIEFHSFCNPALINDVSKIKTRLRSLGFIYLPFPLETSLSLDCDSLFINKKGLGPGLGKRLGILIPLYALKIVLFLPILRLKLGSWKTRLLSHPSS
jgi:FkbM family methyltransferase